MYILGAAAVLPEPTGGERGGEEENGGEYSTAAAAGRGSYRGHPERLAEGDGVGLVCYFDQNTDLNTVPVLQSVLIFMQVPYKLQTIPQKNIKYDFHDCFLMIKIYFRYFRLH